MSHYSMGSDLVSHKGKLIQTSVGNSDADKFVQKINAKRSSSYVFIPNGLEHRVDLLSNQIYDTPGKLWLICLSSNKFDVFEDFDIGSKINLL